MQKGSICLHFTGTNRKQMLDMLARLINRRCFNFIENDKIFQFFPPNFSFYSICDFLRFLRKIKSFRFHSRSCRFAPPYGSRWIINLVSRFLRLQEEKRRNCSLINDPIRQDIPARHASPFSLIKWREPFDKLLRRVDFDEGPADEPIRVVVEIEVAS